MNPANPFRCACGLMFVDLVSPGPVCGQCCPKCDGPVDLVDPVRGLHVKREAVQPKPAESQ